VTSTSTTFSRADPISTTSTSAQTEDTSAGANLDPVAFGVTSPSFDEGESIPVMHTCDGADTSPELDILGIPAGTESLVLIVDDPDAPLGTWYHWVEFDILAEPGALDIPAGAGVIGVQSVNSWNLPGYRGPCPPQGEEHRYFFKVFALSHTLDLPEGTDPEVLQVAMESRIIDSVELVGTYAR